MTSEQIAFLNQRHLPFRLTVRETGWLLGFSHHDIKVLTSKGYLKQVGKPSQNSTKFYCTAVIAGIRSDVKWLERASAFHNKHWKAVNDKRPDRGTES